MVECWHSHSRADNVHEFAFFKNQEECIIMFSICVGDPVSTYIRMPINTRFDYNWYLNEDAEILIKDFTELAYLFQYINSPADYLLVKSLIKNVRLD
jgi:hypothetical protein